MFREVVTRALVILYVRTSVSWFVTMVVKVKHTGECHDHHSHALIEISMWRQMTLHALLTSMSPDRDTAIERCHTVSLP